MVKVSGFIPFPGKEPDISKEFGKPNKSNKGTQVGAEGLFLVAVSPALECSHIFQPKDRELSVLAWQRTVLPEAKSEGERK